ncbi:MAG: dienelactone hydrolase family protein [Salinarimonas sp.]|nr:dienelactone hydrolase family protein [Salinarimonas sp.]
MRTGRLMIAGALASLVAGTAAAEDVRYEVAGESFEGYFAAAEDPRGLVLIVHDWDGLDDYERRRADMVAELGFDAFAVDVYGAGNRPETTEARVAATRSVLGDADRMQALMLGALEEARRHSAAFEVLVMGYCFGGTVTLAMARTGEIDDSVGYASFHGNFPGGPDWPEDTPPLLIMHGGIDQNPGMSDLAAFVEEAEAASLTYDVEIYAGADHAFTVFDGARYQERADMRSWATFGRFLDERFGG